MPSERKVSPKTYEYRRFFLAKDDSLDELNIIAACGWHVVSSNEAMRQIDPRVRLFGLMLLLEREA